MEHKTPFNFALAVDCGDIVRIRNLLENKSSWILLESQRWNRTFIKGVLQILGQRHRRHNSLATDENATSWDKYNLDGNNCRNGYQRFGENEKCMVVGGNYFIGKLDSYFDSVDFNLPKTFIIEKNRGSDEGHGCEQ